MIFFQTYPDSFITKLKKSYAFIQDKIEKKSILKRHSLNVTIFFILKRKIFFLKELITEQLLHSEFDYSKNHVTFNRELNCQLWNI